MGNGFSDCKLLIWMYERLPNVQYEGVLYESSFSEGGESDYVFYS